MTHHYYEEGEGPTEFTTDTLGDVFDERVRQHLKWGEQHHEDGSGSSGWGLSADLWKAYNDNQVQLTGDTDWTGILLEEVYEAVAETDLKKLRAELIQVAAVAVAWVEDIDSRGV